ncbi:MAG: hypothetical protein RRB13_02265 [bacterium]|nr:hypothetical protein [bacterium]
MTKEHLPVGSGEQDKKNQQAEQFILEVFHQDSVQERLRAQLQKVVKTELNKMSDLLREAIRDWVQKEKSKHNPEEEHQKMVLLEEKLENFEANSKQLEEENARIKRQVELKEHENKIMLKGIKKFMNQNRAKQ